MKLARWFLALCTVFMVGGSLSVAAQDPTPESTEDIEAVLVHYIGHASFMLTAPDGTRLVFDPYSSLTYDWPDNVEAEVVVIEFSDFQCPACQTHTLEVQPVLDQELIESGQVPAHAVQLLGKDGLPAPQCHDGQDLAGRAAADGGVVFEHADPLHHFLVLRSQPPEFAAASAAPCAARAASQRRAKSR